MKISGYAAVFLAMTLPGTALAQNADPAIAARQGVMAIQAQSLGILGGMARGRIEYDAELASIAAANAAAVGRLDHSILWPEGTDNTSAETRALPAIWENMDSFMGIWADYSAASAALEGAAGDGLEAMQAALGAVGQTCGACHDDYRQPR